MHSLNSTLKYHFLHGRKISQFPIIMCIACDYFNRFLIISPDYNVHVHVHRVAYDYSRADWDGLRDHLRNVPWEDIFKLGASAAASEFCEWVQVGINVYIPHRKYQVKPHSSPWFSAACAAAIVHRNHFFRLYQHNKSSKSKVKFRQASNRCKRVLEAAKFAYATKTKVYHVPETWLSGRLANC